MKILSKIKELYLRWKYRNHHLKIPYSNSVKFCSSLEEMNEYLGLPRDHHLEILPTEKINEI